MRGGIERRELLRCGLAAGAGLWASQALPVWARPVSHGIGHDDAAAQGLATLSGDHIHLRIAPQTLTVDGVATHAIGINGGVPAPLLRLREGQTVTLMVENTLAEQSSIHWHGLLLPFQMDGVPGVSFPGIAPGETFTYRFPVRQSGTYWYHSHSGFQEQMGLYGPIVIDPAAPAADDQVARDHVVLLSDHSATHPHTLFRKLKQQAGYFNRQQQTLAGLLAGKDQPLSERLQWSRMRMDPTDISDVTGAAFRYLVNGYEPARPWTALFDPGERVRLRFINAGGMTIFNVHIPGLAMRVVAADGQPVMPVTIDAFQIAPGETYDVILSPDGGDRAYAIVAEAIDRSGRALAMLAPRAGMTAPVSPMGRRPLATMRDMGMDMGGGGHAHEGGATADTPDMPDMPGMNHQPSAAGHGGGHSMRMRDPANAPGVAMGPGVQSIAPMPADRTGEPGQGLATLGKRVLVYRDLMASTVNPDTRAADREIQFHLTGNMERYMWSFDGKTLAQAGAPVPMRSGERVRVTLINDTMMNHPIHLHGHFFELVTGHGDHSPRKHTVNVAPGGRVQFDVTAEPGDWAFHCHMFFHMHAGMMRVIQVRPATENAA